MLTLVKTSFTLPPNTIKNVYHSIDTEDSPNWRVENLTGGTTYVVPGGINNLSDGYYCKHTKRFGSIQNNTGIIREYDEASFLTGTPTQLRSITITGTDGADTEGICDMEPNFLEGGYSSYVGEESGGANRSYRVEWSRAELTGLTDIGAKTIRNRRTHAANAAGTNEGCEGVDRDFFTEIIYAVQEGRAIDPPIAFQYAEPTNRDTNYIHTDPELTVTNPYNANAVLDGTHDQSSIAYHAPTNTLVVLSEIGNTIYQISLATGLEISRKSIATHLGQPEGLSFYGDKLVVWGEPDQYRIYDYVAP